MTPGVTGATIVPPVPAPRSGSQIKILTAGTGQVRQLPTMTARSSPQTGPVSQAGGTPGAGALMTSRPGLVGGLCRGRPAPPDASQVSRLPVHSHGG